MDFIKGGTGSHNGHCKRERERERERLRGNKCRTERYCQAFFRSTIKSFDIDRRENYSMKICSFSRLAPSLSETATVREIIFSWLATFDEQTLERKKRTRTKDSENS